MKKAIALALLGACLAGAAWAQTAGTNTQAQGGFYFNAKTGAKTDADDNQYFINAAPDYMDGQVLTIIDAISVLASGQSAKVPVTEALDLRTYRSATLILTWDSRDS
ncbi:MAG TPA: hypothetical protein PLF26_21435, partial [Blastocatellia bacterium]|nr:hypothetical protein [Blastocatellia bacterium]